MNGTYWDILGFRPVRVADQWVITYTTNTTAPQETERSPGYTDGFEDGWNANDVARGVKPG